MGVKLPNPWTTGAKIGAQIGASQCAHHTKYSCVTSKGETSNPNPQSGLGKKK